MADLPDDLAGKRIRYRVNLDRRTGRVSFDRGKWLDVDTGAPKTIPVRRQHVEAVLADPQPTTASALHRQPDYSRPSPLQESVRAATEGELAKQREGYARSCAVKGARQAKTGGVNERYRRWVRTLPCAWCGAPGPSEADHHPCRGHGGGKRDDLLVVPLCSADHRQRTDTRRLGSMSPEDTERWMERRQIELLTAWIRGEAA